MKTVFRWLVLAPVGLAILAFWFLNRHDVPVVLDPLELFLPGGRVEAPLFIVMFACGVLGLLAGSAVTWVNQGRHRRAARDARAEVVRLRAQTPPANSLAPRPAGTSKAA